MKEFFISRYRREASSPEERRALVRIDDAGIITYADTYADPVLGYDAHELTGVAIASLAATPQDNPLSPTHRESLDSGEPPIRWHQLPSCLAVKNLSIHVC